MCPARVYQVPEHALGLLKSGDANLEGKLIDVHVLPVQLRAVRGDHREGRAPDASRGRRRAELPDHVSRIAESPRLVHDPRFLHRKMLARHDAR